MTDEELLHTALRVLSSYVHREAPDERDVAILRTSCPKSEPQEPDLLACEIVEWSLKQRRSCRRPVSRSAAAD